MRAWGVVGLMWGPWVANEPVGGKIGSVVVFLEGLGEIE